MRKILLFLLQIVGVCGGAHTLDEELAVARYLAISIQCSPEWEDNLTTNRNLGVIEKTYKVYDDLFSIQFPDTHIGYSWSVAERRTAFENFISNIPELSTNEAYRTIVPFAGYALSYCQEHGRTNVLESAMRILASKDSVAQTTALHIFEEFAVPSVRINEFVAQVATNATMITPRMRGYFLDAVTRILENHRSSCAPDDFTNGVSIVLAAIRGSESSVALDKLLLGTYPEYETSSNRLAVAMTALSDRGSVDVCYRRALELYFSSITNRLLNAAQPLPEVEALKHLP